MKREESCVLMIDEKPDELGNLRTFLETYEFRVRSTPNTDDILEWAEREKPVLILVHIVNDHDAYAICQRLTSCAPTQDIPCILLLDDAQIAHIMKAYKSDTIEYISRPFQPEDVLHRARAYRKIQQLQDELQAQHSDLSETHRKLAEDLQAAAQIQKTLIPDNPPNIDGFRFAWQFLPCEDVGGDLFNICRLDESHLAIYVLDVSGHGVPSAMVTVSVSQDITPKTGSLVKRSISQPPYYEIVPPSEVLRKLDQEYPLRRFQKYFTISYLILNIRTGHVQYSKAAHPAPVLLNGDGDVTSLESDGPIIGLGELMSLKGHTIQFQEREFTMQPGQRLFLYTDGMTECASPTRDFYGKTRLYQEIQHTRQVPLHDACEHILETVLDHAENRSPQDDITLLGMEYTG